MTPESRAVGAARGDGGCGSVTASAVVWRAYRHVFGHACGHVCGHACRHLCGHDYGHVRTAGAEAHFRAALAPVGVDVVKLTVMRLVTVIAFT